MATYSIRAPDGRTYRIQGPAGASQEEVQAQVMRQYPQAARPARAATPAPAPAARPAGPWRPRPRPAGIAPNSTEAYMHMWQDLPPAQARQLYTQGRQRIEARITDPIQRRRALTQMNADPGVQALRQLGGLQRVTTTRNEIADVAARARAARTGMVEQVGHDMAANRNHAGNFGGAFGAGVRRGLFGLPERLAAMRGGGVAETIRRQMEAPSAAYDDLDYSERLAAIRTATNDEMGRSTSGNIIGRIVGGGAGGLGVARAIGAAGGAMSSSSQPVIQATGNVLQRLTTLVPGQRIRNTARVALGGATGGAAQAAGEGENITEGAVTGAIGGPLLHGAVQGGRQVLRLLRQGTRPFSRSVPRAVREVITEPAADVQARHAEISAQVGENVPVVAALRDRDFRAVTERVLRRSPEATEIAKTHTGRYVRTFMDRMLGHVNRAGRAGNAQNTSIGELAQLRRDTADELMQPIRNRTVDLTQLPLDDLERQMTRQIGGRIQGLAPRVNEALRDLHPDDLAGMGLDPSDVAAARRLMTQWGLGNPVHATVQEMDSLRRALEAAGRSASGSNPANAMAFRNAARAVREFVAAEVPAYGQMVDTYAAQSRIMEGFETAAGGRRIGDIEDDLLRTNLRTPEGRVGMKAGELYRQREAVTGRTTGAISAARDFAAEGRLTRPASLEPDAAQPGTITENLGEAPAAGLARASQGETRVLNRVLDTEKVNAMARDEGGALAPEEIVYGAFLGNALNSTKARFLASLLAKLPHGFNPRVANNLADMLFSQNADDTARAFRALTKMGIGQRVTTGLMRNALPVNMAVGATAAGGAGTSPDEGQPDGEIPSVESDLAALEQPGGDQELPEELAGAPQPITPGNLPLDPQTQVQNEDGSISTVRTISVGTDDGEVLIPTVIDGRVVPDEEAIRHYQETGENFGTFRTPEEADAYAEALHQYHARLTAGQDDEQAPVDENAAGGGGDDGEGLPYGHAVVSSIYPNAHITQDLRDPDSALGRANPGSYHNSSGSAVDVRPIPGMTFEQFIQGIEDEGYEIIEKRDEVRNPSRHATGPHWHVVIAQR